MTKYKYNLILHSLGPVPHTPELHELDVEAFVTANSIERMAHNLDNIWAWKDTIVSDGPCVAIVWSK